MDSSLQPSRMQLCRISILTAALLGEMELNTCVEECAEHMAFASSTGYVLFVLCSFLEVAVIIRQAWGRGQKYNSDLHDRKPGILLDPS